MRTFWTIALGLGFLANGAFMLFAPETWFGLVPGVKQTGPFNLHLVRDVGCAYLVAGLSLAWMLRDPRAWPAAMASGIFLFLHAATHVVDALAGRVELLHIASDAVLVVVPAVAVLILARPLKTWK